MRENQAVNDGPAVAVIRTSRDHYPISPTLAPVLFTPRYGWPSARMALVC